WFKFCLFRFFSATEISFTFRGINNGRFIKLLPWHMINFVSTGGDIPFNITITSRCFRSLWVLMLIIIWVILYYFFLHHFFIKTILLFIVFDAPNTDSFLLILILDSIITINVFRIRVIYISHTC